MKGINEMNEIDENVLNKINHSQLGELKCISFDGSNPGCWMKLHLLM